MLRMMTAAAAIALVATSPALAEKGGNHGGGHGHGQGNENHGKGGKHGDESRGDGNRGDDRASRVVRVEQAPRYVSRDRGEMDRGYVVRVSDRRDREDDRYDDDRYESARGCPPGLAKKHNGCMPPGLVRDRADYPASYVTFDRGQRLEGIAYQPSFFGLEPRNGDRYVYRDGYLVADGPRQVMIPLLGGALAVGQVWPTQYTSTPLADWQTRYYGFDGNGYRYSDNVVYQIDPKSAAIQSVAALLTGSDFTVGQPMPMGYDVYNVPYAYRSQYYDNDQAMYRFADGRIYQIDPATMLVAKAIDAVL